MIPENIVLFLRICIHKRKKAKPKPSVIKKKKSPVQCLSLNISTGGRTTEQLSLAGTSQSPSSIGIGGSARADFSMPCSTGFWPSPAMEIPQHLCTIHSGDQLLRPSFHDTRPELPSFQPTSFASCPIAMHLWEASVFLFTTNLQPGSCRWQFFSPSLILTGE